MKRFFTLCFLTFLTGVIFCTTGKAQNIYWGAGEGFNNTTGHINSTSTLVPAGPTADTADNGIWILYQAYRTTGSDCFSASHVRGFKTVNANASDGPAPFLVTPDLGFGVQSISYYSAGSNKVVYLSYTTQQFNDTAANAITNATWTTVARIKHAVSCTDTTITLNLPTARRIKILDSAVQQLDIDSVLLISTSVITPVSFGGISATATNGVVKVNWSILTSTNTKEYIIERSDNGGDFAPIGTLDANGASNYNWIDNAPLSGTGFYKVEAVDVSGSINYSTIVSASTLGSGVASINVAPNPVTTSQFTLQLNNLAKGNYSLKIFTTGGQEVLNSEVSTPGGNYSTIISLPSLGKGLYEVHVGNFNKTIVVE